MNKKALTPDKDINIKESINNKVPVRQSNQLYDGNLHPEREWFKKQLKKTPLSLSKNISECNDVIFKTYRKGGLIGCIFDWIKSKKTISNLNQIPSDLLLGGLTIFESDSISVSRLIIELYLCRAASAGGLFIIRESVAKNVLFALDKIKESGLFSSQLSLLMHFFGFGNHID